MNKEDVMLVTEYKCKTITPMFLHGANTQEVELRAIAFKSAMRFWWRSLHPQLDGVALLKAEEEIFGGINQVKRKSSFQISVKCDDDQKKFIGGKEKALLMPHKKNDPRKCISIGFEFTVVLAIHGKSKENDNLMMKLENIFELMSILGGIGQRARRGAGSFCIVGKKRNGGNLEWKDSTIDAIIKKNLENDVSQMEVVRLDDKKIKTIHINSDKMHLVSLRSIKEIKIAKESHITSILEKIGVTTHESLQKTMYISDDIIANYLNDDIKLKVGEALGSTQTGKLSSPVYISLSQLDGELYLMISKLQYAPYPRMNKKTDFHKYKKLDTIQDIFIEKLQEEVREK